MTMKLIGTMVLFNWLPYALLALAWKEWAAAMRRVWTEP